MVPSSVELSPSPSMMDSKLEHSWTRTVEPSPGKLWEYMHGSPPPCMSPQPHCGRSQRASRDEAPQFESPVSLTSFISGNAVSSRPAKPKATAAALEKRPCSASGVVAKDHISRRRHSRPGTASSTTRSKSQKNASLGEKSKQEAKIGADDAEDRPLATNAKPTSSDTLSASQRRVNTGFAASRRASSCGTSQISVNNGGSRHAGQQSERKLRKNEAELESCRGHIRLHAREHRLDMATVDDVDLGLLVTNHNRSSRSLHSAADAPVAGKAAEDVRELCNLFIEPQETLAPMLFVHRPPDRWKGLRSVLIPWQLAHRSDIATSEAEQNAIRELRAFEESRVKRGSRASICTPDETDIWGSAVLMDQTRSGKNMDENVDELGWAVPDDCIRRYPSRKSSTGKRISRLSPEQSRRHSRKSIS